MRGERRGGDRREKRTAFFITIMALSIQGRCSAKVNLPAHHFSTWI
jgi:hypothetical protein